MSASLSLIEMAKMKLLFTACFFIGLASAKEYREPIQMGKGIPVPHADFIERLIKRTMFPNKTEDQSFLELYGDVSGLDNATLARLQNLEYSVLDVDNVKLYLELGRRSVAHAPAPDQPTRRKMLSSFDRYDGHIMRTLLSLMQQSVYSTRLMLQRTNPIRARYRSDISFNIGQMYGSLMELKSKGARALTTMNYLKDDDEIKMVWYLLLYERVLQIHTDSTTMVERIFQLNRGGAKSLLNENPEGDAYKAEERKKKTKASRGQGK